MSVNAKKMAFLGLLLACTVILVILSGVIEFNTLFLLAAASFFVGIAIRESGLRLGAGFFLASILLSLMLTPNKFYCITYGAMAFYLVVIEFTWEKLSSAPGGKKRLLLFWMIKYICFNLMFISILLFAPKLIFSGEISPVFFVGIIILGQIFLFVFDRAYEYFQKFIWGKLRGRFM